MEFFGHKLRQIVDTADVLVAMAFHCPGCDNLHTVYVKAPSFAPARDTWSFNWDAERPTFSPSYLLNSHRWEPPVTPANVERWREAPWKQEKKLYICHSFITDGRIQFLDDCTHHLRGQTVDLPDLEKP